MPFVIWHDIETVGQFMHASKTRKANSMTVIGTCVMNEKGVVVEPLKNWYLKDRKGCDREKRCLKWWNRNAKSRAALKYNDSQARDAETVFNEYRAWYNKMHLKYPDSPNGCDNPGYDMAWIDLYNSMYTDQPCSYYGLIPDKNGKLPWRKTIDADAFIMGAFAERYGRMMTENEAWTPAKSMGCQNSRFTNSHDASEDAANNGANYALYNKLRKIR